ncbi:hypothetical protein EDB83DRAFT_2314400 [Lactarius deliciosus]|nr:hypothetical protein EDB83DRAFT_2314400 [Lactarius deliciosus]
MYVERVSIGVVPWPRPGGVPSNLEAIHIWVTLADALVKLYHVIWGVLIWEFVVNIGFEYSVFTGKRKFRSSFLECGMVNSSWYIQLYLAARWFPLFTIIGILVRFDSANRINCQVPWLFALLSQKTRLRLYPGICRLYLREIMDYFPDYMLMGGRVVVFISLDDFCLGPDRAAHVAISIAPAAWLADTGSLIHNIPNMCPGSGVAVVRATWSGGICKITNPFETKINFLVTFITDLVLLALMLTGLLRWENAHQRGSVWWLLYAQRQQGLAWMIIVVVAEALVTVFVLLNLNGVHFFHSTRFNIHQEYFHRTREPLITMTICASRVYRGLSDYVLYNEASIQMSGRLSEPPIRPKKFPRTEAKRYARWPYVRNGSSGTTKKSFRRGNLMEYGEIELCRYAVDTSHSSVHHFIGVCACALTRRVNQPPPIIVK